MNGTVGVVFCRFYGNCTSADCSSILTLHFGQFVVYNNENDVRPETSNNGHGDILALGNSMHGERVILQHTPYLPLSCLHNCIKLKSEIGMAVQRS